MATVGDRERNGVEVAWDLGVGFLRRGPPSQASHHGHAGGRGGAEGLGSYQVMLGSEDPSVCLCVCVCVCARACTCAAVSLS